MNHRKNKYESQYTGNQVDLERTLVIHIGNTGQEQIRRRRKANLSVYYSKNGRIVEVKPDNTEIAGKKIESRWVKLDKSKRTVVLK